MLLNIYSNIVEPHIPQTGSRFYNITFMEYIVFILKKKPQISDFGQKYMACHIESSCFPLLIPVLFIIFVSTVTSDLINLVTGAVVT